MKIIYDNVGQTCNRLWSLVPTIYYNKVLNNKILVLFKGKDFDKFDHLRSCGNVTFIFKNKFMVKAFGNKYVQKIYSLLSVFPFLNLVNGWKSLLSFNVQYSKDDIDYMRSVFLPNQTIVERVNKQFMPKISLVIGIHVRRGDYRRFLNGKYFFEREDYEEVMEQLISYFKDPNILFFISSNEKIQFSDKYHTFCLNDGGAIDDLYGLSICDYIVGPPSTFSQFASFLGQKPLLILWEKKQKIIMENFAVYNHLSYTNSKEENLSWLNSIK